MLPEQPGRILFIGSGPLPLTSILFAAMYGIRIDNVDVDPQACAAGRALAERLGLVNKLRFLHADGAQFADMGAHEVVFIAALVGLRRAEKQRIIRNVARHGRADAMLVVRSAHRLRALLYPEIKAAQMAPFIPLLEIHPHHDVINSVVVAGRPAVPAHPPAWSGLPVVADVEAF